MATTQRRPEDGVVPEGARRRKTCPTVPLLSPHEAECHDPQARKAAAAGASRGADGEDRVTGTASADVHLAGRY